MAWGCFCSIYLHCKVGLKYGVYGKNIWCCLWHSLLACEIASFLFFLNGVVQKRKGYISRVLLWISRYEYGIYLWHLMIMNNLLEKSGFIQRLLNEGKHVLVYVIFCACSTVMGYIMTELLASSNPYRNKTN